MIEVELYSKQTQAFFLFFYPIALLPPSFLGKPVVYQGFTTSPPDWCLEIVSPIGFRSPAHRRLHVIGGYILVPSRFPRRKKPTKFSNVSGIRNPEFPSTGRLGSPWCAVLNIAATKIKMYFILLRNTLLICCSACGYQVVHNISCCYLRLVVVLFYQVYLSRYFPCTVCLLGLVAVWRPSNRHLFCSKKTNQQKFSCMSGMLRLQQPLSFIFDGSNEIDQTCR